MLGSPSIVGASLRDSRRLNDRHQGEDAIGAATGLVINEWAQVTKADDHPIAGLYACGNEANSIMGGVYPGPGITIGPAIAFAHRAVRHALGDTDVRRAA